ncbi:MAG: type II toxin-antitoxin system VapC family toxin [Nostocaceae cyanobacterium]|nr:type II toxin-antitoxin system VapC family toxin [Nostocaceae cyanobacterium]
MSQTAYIETSIFGYLTARSTKNLILAANIEVTRDWWANYRGSVDIYVSQLVLDEAALGDEKIATQRLDILQNLALLEPNEVAEELVTAFLTKSNLPPKAANDAAHIAIATVHSMNYLLTWNCKHIANAHIQKKLRQICSDFGYDLPTICTPYEMMGE